MLKVNRTTNIMRQAMIPMATQEESTQEDLLIVEAYEVVESDASNIMYEVEVKQDDEPESYVSTIVRDDDKAVEIYVDTLIVNTIAGTYSKIMATNNSRKSVKWALISTTTGASLYTTSTTYGKGAVCTIDLKTISTLQTGTEFKLKAIVSGGKDSSSSKLLTFNPESDQTANFKVTGNAVKTSVTYISTTSN